MAIPTISPQPPLNFGDISTTTSQFRRYVHNHFSISIINRLEIVYSNPNLIPNLFIPNLI